MSKIIWLSSYPRSGNTWLRFIIANLVYENVRTSAKVHRLIPDIHQGIKASDLIQKRNVFIKSHLKYFDGLPLREDTLGAIYIARNPLDMIASAINYLAIRDAKDLSQASEEQRRENRQSIIREFLEKGGPDRWTNKGFGTWPEHVLSWHRKDLPFPRFTLRYEDLKMQPVESIAQLCRFINIERSKEQIAAAIASTSFEKMRRMEETEISQGKPGFFAIENSIQAFSAGLRFMNQGITGGYRHALTDAQIAAAKERFDPIMRQLGYLLGK